MAEVIEIPEWVHGVLRNLFVECPNLYAKTIESLALHCYPHARDASILEALPQVRLIAKAQGVVPMTVAIEILSFQSTDDFCHLADAKFPVLYEGVIDYPNDTSRYVQVRRVNEDGTVWATRWADYDGELYTSRSLFACRVRKVGPGVRLDA